MRWQVAKLDQNRGHKSIDYRMRGCVGPFQDQDLDPEAELFNDLLKLDQLHQPTKTLVWTTANGISGIEIQYANKVSMSHGICKVGDPYTLHLDGEISETIVDIVVKESIDTTTKKTLKTSPTFATLAGKILDTALVKIKIPETKEGESPPAASVAFEDASLRTTITMFTQPDDPRYSLRGFFGFTMSSTICTLGFIWGKDSFVPVPAAPLLPPLCWNILNLPDGLQEFIQSEGPCYAGKFFMSTSISTSENSRALAYLCPRNKGSSTFWMVTSRPTGELTELVFHAMAMVD